MILSGDFRQLSVEEGLLKIQADMEGAQLHIDEDDNILLIGVSHEDPADRKISLIKLDPDGVISKDFGRDGIAEVTLNSSSVAIKSSAVNSAGTAYLLVNYLDFYSQSQKSLVAAIDSMGRLDARFGADGLLLLEENVSVLEVLEDGSLLLFGQTVTRLSESGDALEQFPNPVSVSARSWFFYQDVILAEDKIFGLTLGGFEVSNGSGQVLLDISPPRPFRSEIYYDDFAIDPNLGLLGVGEIVTRGVSGQVMTTYPIIQKIRDFDELYPNSDIFGHGDWEIQGNLPGGIFDSADSVVSLADGSFVTVGMSSYLSSGIKTEGIAVRKIDATGEFSREFNNGAGYLRIETGTKSHLGRADVALNSAGELIVLGEASLGTGATDSLAVFKLSASGRVDSDFARNMLPLTSELMPDQETSDNDYSSLGLPVQIAESGYSSFGYASTRDEVQLHRNDDASWTSIIQGKPSKIFVGYTMAYFDDAYVRLDLEGVGGQAYRIYKAAFDRDPMDGDTGGLGYWIAQMDEGMDMVEVAARFIDSDEFRSLYGQNPTNGEFLNKVYLSVLDRLPDAEGYIWWIDQLENNPEKTWQKVLADFSESSENQANVAELIANGIVFDPWVG